MNNHECPKCGHYKYSANMSNLGCGVMLLVIVPIICLLVPGGSSYYGGNTSFSDVGGIAILSMIVGVIVIVYSILFPQKEITYKCSHCGFENKHKM
jgi:predicted RNA-binding Zn-ribbon protein involved in translation (DUF1610 family)